MIIEPKDRSTTRNISHFLETNFKSEVGDDSTTPCKLMIPAMKEQPATYNLTAQFTSAPTDEILCYLLTNKVINGEMITFKSFFSGFYKIWEDAYTETDHRHIQIELPNCDGISFERSGGDDGDIYGTISVHRIPFNN